MLRLLKGKVEGGGVMDSVTAAALVAAALFARKVLEETGTAAGKSLSAGAGRLVTWLRRAGTRSTEVSSALRSIESAPHNAALVEELGIVIAEYVRGDSLLEHELMTLAEECRTAGDVITIGGAHIHGNVSGGKIAQYGGDHIEFR